MNAIDRFKHHISNRFDRIYYPTTLSLNSNSLNSTNETTPDQLKGIPDSIRGIICDYATNTQEWIFASSTLPLKEFNITAKQRIKDIQDTQYHTPELVLDLQIGKKIEKAGEDLISYMFDQISPSTIQLRSTDYDYRIGTIPPHLNEIIQLAREAKKECTYIFLDNCTESVNEAVNNIKHFLSTSGFVALLCLSFVLWCKCVALWITSIGVTAYFCVFLLWLFLEPIYTFEPQLSWRNCIAFTKTLTFTLSPCFPVVLWLFAKEVLGPQAQKNYYISERTKAKKVWLKLFERQLFKS